MAWKHWATRVAWFAAGVVVAVAVQHALAIRSGLLQISNLVKGRAYVAGLESYRASHHAYPARLDLVVGKTNQGLDGRDAWGTPMLYKTDGQRFVLISFGADRRLDYYGDPIDLRLRSITPMNAPFPFWSTRWLEGQVASSRLSHYRRPRRISQITSVACNQVRT